MPASDPKPGSVLEGALSAMKGPEHLAHIRRAVIAHLSSGPCTCDPDVGAVPCEVCAMGEVKKWAQEIDSAHAALSAAAGKALRVWYCRVHARILHEATMPPDNVCPFCGSLVNGCGWATLIPDALISEGSRRG